jgi:DNA repair protein SbcC/Rad50
MRILAIRGSNIASLERFDVDFRQEPLASAGIFAITGPTGAGKSSLLDAMCLALFHKAPRLEGVSGQEAKVGSAFGEIGQDDIRNLIRRGAVTGFAETDFQGVDGGSYRARWGYRAGKRSNAAPQEEVSLVRLSDNQVLESKKTEFRDRVVKLCGLTFDQFSRTVLLAQGRFAEFLKSKENERAELLEKLTGTGIYSRISKAIYDRKVSEEKARDELQARLQGIQILGEAERLALEADAERLERELPVAIEREAVARGFQDAAQEWRAVARERAAQFAGIERSKGLVAQAVEALASAEARQTEFARWSREREREIQDALVLDERIGTQARQFEEISRRLTESVEALSGLERARAVLEAAVARRDLDLATIGRLLESRSRLGPVAADWQQCRTLLELCARLRGDERRDGARLAEFQARISELSPREAELAGLAAEFASEFGERSFEEVSAIGNAERKRLDELKSARALFELELREKACSSRRLELANERDAKRDDLARRESGLAVARRMLDAARLASSADVGSLRRNLTPGEECPVCGSREHPLGAGDGERLDAVFARQQAMVDALEGEANAARAAVSRLDAGIEQAEVESRRIGVERERCGAMSDSVRALLEGVAEQERADWFASRIEEAEAAVRSAERLLEAFAAHSRRRSELSELRRTLDSDRLESRQCEEAVARCAEEFAKHSGVLDAKFGGDAWRSKWEADPAGYLEQMDRKVDEYKARIAEKERLEREQGVDRERSQGLEPQIAARRRESADLAGQRGIEGQVLTERRRAREGLLEGTTVPQAREESERRRLLAQQGVDEARAKSDSARQEMRRAEGAFESLVARTHALESKLEADGPAVAAACGGDWGACRPGEVFDADTLGCLARTAFEQATEALRAGQNEQVRIGTELDIDRRNRASVADLQAEIDRQSGVAAKWGNLSAAIGSAEGNKFKIIAQQFTLESLLVESNRELSVIAPRYSLRMLGESMHFGVVDHDSFGELRPVHTLSGGETFLVSLALALGLSRMAGGELAVESLFIDEGFGTLDADTLRCVMVALSSLHAQGRKVGLITHVEEMKEQIPVRIEVVKMGQGTSRVEVRG